MDSTEMLIIVLASLALLLIICSIVFLYKMNALGEAFIQTVPPSETPSEKSRRNKILGEKLRRYSEGGTFSRELTGEELALIED